MSPRIPVFVAVGAAGFVVQLTVLYALTSGAGWAYPLSTLVAVEAAVLHNFVWHERWTWKERAGGRGPMGSRLLRYHVGTGLTSLVGNLAFTTLAVEWWGLSPGAANTVAVGLTSLANFLIADRWVFTAPATATFAAVLLVLPAPAAAAELKQATIHSWNRHVAMVESSLDAAVVARVGAAPEGRSVDIAGGTIHEWRGAVVIPGITVEALVDALETPGLPPPSEDVLEARVLEKHDHSLRVYLKFERSAIVTVTYDSVHDVTFTRSAPGLAASRSVATFIREDGGADRGFLWRLNSYWRYEQRGPDVVITMLSLSLSRDVPTLVKPVASPLIASIGRESMVRTLAAVERFGRRLG